MPVTWNSVLVLLVCSLLCLLTVHGHFSVSLTDTPCTPRHARTCGKWQLLSEVSTPLEESDDIGPNICMVTKTYEVKTRAYVLANYCFRSGRCRSYCTRTRNCTGPVKNVTISKAGCCDGFAVNPDDVTVNSLSFRQGRKSGKLRKSTGCTLMLRESVTDCLLELELDEFTLRLLTDFPDTANQLGSSDGKAGFTVFGVNDMSFNSSTNTLGHVVNGTVRGKRLRTGTVLQTLAENVFLHIRRIGDKGVFVNGVEVTQLNACQARNGIVHIVGSALPLSNRTITGTLRGDPRFTMFVRLLDGVNITSKLDVANGKSRTLLAPTNDAIGKLPDGAVDCLLREENRRSLYQLVLIHISSPAEYSATLSQLSRLYTFNSRYYLIVQVEGGDILLTRDRIPLEESDISANNGVIHALPEVIVPLEVDFDKLNCAATTAAPATTSVPQVVGA